MTIKQLLDMPIGQKVGGFELTVKKYPSKMVEVGKKKIQPVTFIDETGEMVGDVLNAKYGAIHKGYKIHITVGVIQNGEKGKKLFVEQWWIPSITADEYEAKREADRKPSGESSTWEEEVVPSMIRNSQVREFIGGYASKHGTVPECTLDNRKALDRWVAYIETGE